MLGRTLLATQRRKQHMPASENVGFRFIAEADAKDTASVWWPQGFVREEDVGFSAVMLAFNT